MMLVIVLLRSINYENVETETQVRKSIWKQTKNQGMMFTRQNTKQKGKDLEMLCNSNIKNVMCLRLESG